ncbi:IgGFc-binding protein-like isoform X2 [Dreissena polymorpha]|nr:IgGFc-binding protein-like isoform X2 [Dreissena polymorpha]
MFGIPETYDSSPDYIKLFIASKYVSKVYITAPGISFNQTITTLANTSTAVTIPISIVARTIGLSNKAVYIESDQTISVYVMVRDENTSDGFLLLPISADSRDYFVASYEPVEHASEFIITAYEDKTLIDVQLKTSAGPVTIGGQSYSSGQNVSFVMSRMQTYFVKHEHDLTGTHITSSRPVSVVSGNKCANVPHDKGACDYLAEQLLPVAFWQREYVCAKLKTRGNNRLRILASVDGTTVNIGGTHIKLNKGEFYEYVNSSDVATSVKSNFPVLVLQFSEGTLVDSVLGDPSMITIPSTNSQESEYFYETPFSIDNHYVSITIHTDQAKGLRIDGSAISRSDELKTTINTIEFSIIRLSVNPGKHHLFHVDQSVTFGVIVYGFKKDESYGFPLGLSTNDDHSLSELFNSSCSSTSWHIDIDMDKLRHRNPGSVATDIYFGVNSCTGHKIGNHLIFDYDIETCLTSTQTNGSEIVYTNQLVYAYHDPNHNFIIHSINWTQGISCHIQWNESDHSYVTYNQPTGGNNGSTNSTTSIQTQFFIDPNFQQEITGNPLNATTGAKVFVKTFVQNVDWTVKMKLHSCYAEPNQNGHGARYFLINNGCEMDANTHFLSQTDHETRFEFQAFPMTGPDQRLYIKCDATLCDTADVMSSHRCDQRPNCA